MLGFEPITTVNHLIEDKMRSAIPHWYLVKRNWPRTKARFPFYAGLGGEVWPFDFGFNFDAANKTKLQNLHTRMEQSRQTVNFGSHSRFVCTDAAIAKEYFTAVEDFCGEAWMLEVTNANVDSSKVYGFDIGFPDGGFSVIEQELITQSLPGPKLNEWGLFQTSSEAVTYSEARKKNEELEHLDEIMIVSIRVLSNNPLLAKPSNEKD
jgi:hypothetical protein